MPNIYFGQNAVFELVSLTHGKFELGFVENLEVEVQLTNKRLYFFNKKEAFAISIFEGVSGRFGYLESEEKYFLAAVMDIAPSATVVNDDPSAYNVFHIINNCKNEAGTVEQGVFVKGCRVTGLPESMAPREEQHGTVSYIGQTRYKIKGGGIVYSRFTLSGTTAYVATGDITVSGTGPFSGTITQTALNVNVENNSTTRTYLAVYKNGSDLTKDTTALTGFSVTGTQVVFPSGSFDTGDVWEVFTAYKPA